MVIYFIAWNTSLSKKIKGGDIIGRMVIIEFDDRDSGVFDEVMEFLSEKTSFERLQIKETDTSFPDLVIHPRRRLVYCNDKEIHLTTKEIDILCMLVENRGRVMTYEQIYQNVWDGFPSGEIKSTIGYHIRNLRKKLCSPFSIAIRNIREVGYCFELKSKKYDSLGNE